MRWIKFIVVLLLAGWIAGCGSADANTITIGIIAPTSGNASVYGNASANGSRLAFDEINKSGGLLGRQINVVVYDDQHDSDASVKAYYKLVDKDNAVAVIGAVTSKPSAAVAEAARADRMPVITPTATEDLVTAYGDHIFRACYVNGYQSSVMAAFARDELDAQTAAVLYNAGDGYSAGLAEAFIKGFKQAGGVVVSEECYAGEDKDFKKQLRAIKDNTPDVLFIPDYYNTIALIAAQVQDVGLEAVLLGSDGWDGIFYALDDKKLIEGAYYCAHYAEDDADTGIQNFKKKYEAVYNQTPNSFAALGYDAARVMAAAIEKAGSEDKESIIDALKQTQYQGVTGDIRFDANGDPVKSVAVLKVQNEEARLFKKIYPSL